MYEGYVLSPVEFEDITNNIYDFNSLYVEEI
jgi:hypothetical protein